MHSKLEHITNITNRLADFTLCVIENGPQAEAREL